jgi:hypothetical protein
MKIFFFFIKDLRECGPDINGKNMQDDWKNAENVC